MKQVVYVASTESHQIHVWQMNEHGEMSLYEQYQRLIQVQPLITAPDGPSSLCCGQTRAMRWRLIKSRKTELTPNRPDAAPGTAAYITLD